MNIYPFVLSRKSDRPGTFVGMRRRTRILRNTWKVLVLPYKISYPACVFPGTSCTRYLATGICWELAEARMRVNTSGDPAMDNEVPEGPRVL